MNANPVNARRAMSPSSPRLLATSLLALASVLSPARSQPVEMSPVFVTATRAGETAEAVPFSHVTVAGDALRAAPNLSVDGVLREIPGFSLFRRTDSIVANPTAQGVSLRGLGPSGASRSLILLDGVPLNDPFGGWVLWSKVPRESLAGIEVVPGAGGTAWGNAALGGVIQLFTEAPAPGHARFVARTGSFDTHEAEAQVNAAAGAATLQLLGRAFSTDGFHTVAPERRGPIDTRATSESQWLTGRWRQPLGDALTATLTVRRFHDERGNGTPYQQNHSDETFASVAVAAQPSAGWHWTATAYAQSQDFAATFSSVNATRTAETPASNQFAVPATTLGLAWVGERRGPGSALTSFGADVRDVRGETREDSGYVSGAFTRRRFAGGRQTNAGLFGLHSRALGADETWRGSAGARLDGWRDADGHRRDFLNGEPAGNEAFARREGVEFSPTAGVIWRPRDRLALHLSGQHAFRRPTLNELYRPFRVGNVITEANPDLRTETVTSAELGVRFEPGAFAFGAAAFRNDLHDAVANVTVARGPATVPGIGFIPAGGEGRRRLNLERTRVQGLALDATWTLTPDFAVVTHYLWNDSAVRRASAAPALTGRRLAQVPAHSASAGLRWTVGRWTFEPRARYLGEQFEDDLNALPLASATVVDIAARVTLNASTEVFVTAENLFDERIETGRSADGLVNVGPPRLLLVGLRLTR